MTEQQTAVYDPRPLQWAEGIDLPTAREILRLAELHMEDQQALTVSSDGRAATLATGMATVSAGLLIAVVASLTADNPMSLAVTIGLLVSSTAFLVAAVLAILAALPTDYALRGYTPRHLTNAGGDELQLLKWTVEDVSQRIVFNDTVAGRSGRLMNGSYLAAAAGIALPIIAAAAGLLYR